MYVRATSRQGYNKHGYDNKINDIIQYCRPNHITIR